MSGVRLDAVAIGSALAQSTRALAVDLLGDPNRRLSTKTQWRWRRRGSLAVVVTGRRAGCWYDHEAGVGGDVLDLIKRELNCSFGQALAWSGKWLGAGPQADSDCTNIPPKEPDDVDQARIQRALAIWQESERADGTLVERYLRRRGIVLADAASAVLRYHPRLYHAQGPCPGMVALMRCIATDTPCAVHRTFLSPDASRRERKILGRARGAAIKLCADEEVTAGLGIAEGIETALAVIGVGWRPIWALGSAGTIRRFPVLAGVGALTIFADHDMTREGERAAELCADRWSGSGAEVTIATPRTPGQDFNDCLGAVG